MYKRSKIDDRTKARLLGRNNKNHRYLSYKARVTPEQIKAFWVLYGKSKTES